MYILECSDGSYYTGSTFDIEVRLGEHKDGKAANYTRRRQPLKLVHCEEYNNVAEAFGREKQIQGWSHAKKKALIENNWDKIKELADPANKSLSK